MSVLANAQDVRPMTSGPSFARSTYAQAQKEGRDWPNLREGDDGTIVNFTADSDDADMTATSSAGEASLLAAVQAAARAAGMPKADFLRRQGTIAASADAEFNDYLQRSGPDTRFVFPLARLLEGLKTARPPFRISIERQGRSAVLIGPKGRRELTEPVTLFTPEELVGYETLETHFHVEPWAPFAAVALIGGPLLAVLSLPFFVLRLVSKKPEPLPTTPEEAQGAYDAQAAQPWWRKAPLGILVPFVFLLPMLTFGKNRSFGAQAEAALPRWVGDAMASPFFFVGSILLPVVLMLPVFFVDWRRNHESPSEPRPTDEPNPLASIWPLLAIVPVMLTMLVVVKLKPDLLRGVPREFVRPAIFAFPLAALGASLFVSFRASRNAARNLPADDPVALAARELGSRAGVRVRRVVERKHGGANAFATLFGTVGITRQLRETLDEDETRAILSHEIGHLKASDPLRFLLLSLPLLLAAFGVAYWIEFRTPLGDVPLVRFAIQMFFFFGLPALVAWAFSPRRRAAEHAADLFAVDQTGDVELVARALVKVHDANLAPHRLHPRDERTASHPALDKRLERLREGARNDRAG